MPRKPKSWRDKFVTSPPHVVRLDKDFAGVPAGARLLVSSPAEVSEHLRQHSRSGQFQTPQQLRKALAQRHGADATCPLSTAIFLRIVAEVAWDDIEAGVPVTEVTPFWRVVEPGSPLAAKLRCGSQWIEQQRAAERAP